MKRWMWHEQQTDEIQELSLAAGTSERISRLLLNRGIRTPEEANIFLYGTLKDLSSPYMLLNMGRAVEMTQEAISKKKKIVVYGDYDVDGICSTVLLQEALMELGADVSIYIPSRLNEGYGLNSDALQMLMESGTEMIITVDNGIAAAEILEPFLKKGLEILVTDHHQLPDRLPDCPIINPQLETDERAPYRNLCGCGVAFMFAKALLEEHESCRKDLSSFASYLELVALATIADIVPLQGDNRLLVKEGLSCLSQTQRPGLRALINLSGVDMAELRAETVSFQLAPRLNAAGRLDRVDLAIDLLQCKDTEKALDLAERLNRLNTERKELENIAFSEAVAQIDGAERLSSIIVYGDNWHVGVIGIVASRLVEAYGVPAIVLTANENDAGIFSGSSRAPEKFDLFTSLSACSTYLEKFGGHEKAAGLSLKRNDLAHFKSEFNAYCVKTRAQWHGKETHLMDATLYPDEINDTLWQELSFLEPTGCGNPKPTFVMESVKDLEMRACGQSDAHLQLLITDGDLKIRGIAFRQGTYAKMQNLPSHDILFHVNKQTFRGKENFELIVDDIRPSFIGNKVWDADLFLRGKSYLKEDEYAGIENSKFFFTKIVGVSFDNRQDILKALSPGTELSLKREPNNPIDQNAIAVEFKDQKVGYLKKGLARHLAPLLDRDIHYDVSVANMTGGKQEQHLGVNITLSKHIVESANEGKICASKAFGAEEIAQMWLGNHPLHVTQKDAFAAMSAGKNTLAVMGTGRGKSLIYQAMAVEMAQVHRKMSIVFFPLRALLNDQYLSISEKFSKMGISVLKAFGELGFAERKNLTYALEEGYADVILTTPEFFIKHESLFKEAKKEIGFFVFDEAHYLCSRRSGYRNLPNILTHYPETLRLALTATVPEANGTQIVSALDIECVFCDETERSNLKLLDYRSEKNKLGYLETLSKTRQKTIVYVNSRKQAWLLACKLRSRLPLSVKNNIGYYHGGLSKQLRSAMMNAFASGEIRFLIATTAFGEGMHIPDIRHVVLYHLCFSIESYNQLAGRAGRDGKPAFIHLLYRETDRSLNEIILSSACPQRPVLANIYQFICNQAAPNGVIVPQFSNWSRLLTMKLNKTIDEQTLYIAVKIFLELGFIERVDDREEASYIVIKDPPKRSLHESAVFLEGVSEYESYKRYDELAFERNLDRLLQMVRKPLCPTDLLQRGGAFNG